MADYEAVWDRFVRERRLEFGGHNDPSWQEGHRYSASLVVPGDAWRFRERLEPLREALRPFSFVSLHPDHFMHITLVLLGFLVDEPEDADEISRERLREIEDRARRVLSDFPAFTVDLANLNAFPGAAFIEAHDGGKIDELRAALSLGCGLKKPSGPPHLTLAYFQAPDGTEASEELVSAMAEFRRWPIGEITVDNVEITLLHLDSDCQEAETLARIALGEAIGDQSAADG
jgi:RNA 2',3'-cyclic 3'-phosphodiesterase